MAEIHPPIGTVIAYAGNFTPAPEKWEAAHGWMICDGRSLNRTDPKFTELFNAIGSSWGGDGANMFNLPDLRGYFLRGVSGESKRDPDTNNREIINSGGHSGNSVGSIQKSALMDHIHALPAQRLEAEGGKGFEGNGHDSNSNPNGGHGGPRSSAGVLSELKSSETRPINAYVHWIIRWQ